MKGLPRLRSAVQSAFAKMRPAGLQDSELMKYNKLKPHDFAALISRHGEEIVIQYIKDMEAKRRQYGTNSQTTGTA